MQRTVYTFKVVNMKTGSYFLTCNTYDHLAWGPTVYSISAITALMADLIDLMLSVC